MNQFEYKTLLLLIELIVIVPLYKTYGGAGSWEALWLIFCRLDELGQIGTATCAVLLLRAGLHTTIAVGQWMAGLFSKARDAARGLALASFGFPSRNALAETQTMHGEQLSEQREFGF